MTPEEFRSAGYQLIDWIADYRATAAEQRVRADVKPGEVASWWPDEPPSDTIEMAELLQQLDQRVLPGLTNVQHPRNFAWFPSGASLSSVLGDLASSGLGSLGISWESSPALTEVEQVVVDWMRQHTGLSEAWVGTIHDTASTSCLVALIVARERATELSSLGGGLTAVDAAPVVYTSAQAHSSVRKGALLAGFGDDHLRLVAHDPATFAMDVDDLARCMAEDAAAGRRPAAVVATAGSTGTTAFDPIEAVVEVASHYEAWVHVDAAMAGTAMMVEENRHLWAGVEGADSLTWNPHKWMGIVPDLSLFYVRDPEFLVRVLSSNPSYLRSSDSGAVQYRDWGIPLGRRFRALKLLFQLSLDGIESTRQQVRRDMGHARWLAEQVDATPDWEVVAPVQLETVCVRHRPVGTDGQPLDGDALDRHTLAWVDAVNRSGVALLTPSVLDGRWMVRVAIGAPATEQVHVAETWTAMQEQAREARP
jgi:aromatic-L-amino-acid decarboxylase